MKGSVLTTRTLILLVAAALLVAAGGLNFWQRWKHKSPPTDGITWTQKGNAIFAEKVAPGLTGARSGILPGDHLISISEDETQYDSIARYSDVQIYLEEAGVGGHLTYLIERPSFPEETRFYDDCNFRRVRPIATGANQS